MRKWLVFILFVVAIVIGGIYLYGRRQVQAQEQILANLQTVAAERGDLVTTIGGTGTVETNQSAILSWQTSGIVDEVLVEIGDKVKADQVMATLKQTSLPQNVILAQADLASAQKSLEELYETDLAAVESEQAIVQARDALRIAQARVDGLGRSGSQADIDVAEATVLLAKIKLDRAWDDFKPYEKKSESNPVRAALFNKYAQAKQEHDLAVRRLNNLQGTPSDLTFELAQADLDVAQANLEEAQRIFEELQAGPDPRDIAAIQARIAAAQATLAAAQISAPFDGTVMDINVKPGDSVSASNAFRLDDLTRLLVKVPISEVDIGRVTIGQDATLTFDAIPDQVYKGVVSDVANVGVVNQGVVDFHRHDRTYRTP